MGKVGLFYHDKYLEHEPRGYHPEQPSRAEAIMEQLRLDGRMDRLCSMEPAPASREDLLRVHAPDHVDRVLEASGSSGSFDPDTYYSPGSTDAALLAAGALVRAVDSTVNGDLDSAFCVVRPPGHHAEKNRAMGFCLFNNAAVAAAYAADVLGLDKVLVVDPDVHHGNGTQHLFETEPRVMYFSSHQYPFYPGTGHYQEVGKDKGRGFTVNCPLPWGMGDPEYARLYVEFFLPLAEAFDPDLVIVSAGFDAFVQDPIGGMRVTADGFSLIADCILSLGKPTVFGLEGGYHLQGLGQCVSAVVSRMLSRASGEGTGKIEIPEKAGKFEKLLGVFVDTVKPYWPGVF